VANHKSAEKRARQNVVRQERNKGTRSRLRRRVREARAAAEAGGEEALERVRRAESELRKAASKGIIPERRARRLVSRLSRRVSARG
jgi:small subunit ribosomal protein S20